MTEKNDYEHCGTDILWYCLSWTLR